MAESQNYKDIYEFADFESELDVDEFEADVPEVYEGPQSILRTLEARAKRKALHSERLNKKKHLSSPKSYTSKSSTSATKIFTRSHRGQVLMVHLQLVQVQHLQGIPSLNLQLQSLVQWNLVFFLQLQNRD